MTIEEVVRRVLLDEHADVLREALELLVRELMEAEVSELVGAELGERRPEDRATHRNGYRARRWDTRAGEIELQIPKLRQGSYFPGFLKPRKRSEQALVVGGPAGLRVRRLDASGRPAGRVARAAGMPLGGVADLLAARRAGRGVSRASSRGPLSVPVRRREGGEGPRRWPCRSASVSSSRTPSTRPAAARSSASTSARPRPRPSGGEFLRSLVKRGLTGVQLAVSDAHPGLKAALAQVLGCPWQRCTVHFLRDCLGHARTDQHGLLGALIRPLFAAASGEEARQRLGEAVAQLERPLPKVAALIEEAEDDILAFYAFPADHWRKLRSTDESVKARCRLD